MSESREALLSFNQLAAILAARRSIIILIAAVAVIVTGVVSSILPKTYRASADVFLDYRGSDPISGRLFHPMQEESYLETQFAMIKSVQVAERVIDALQLQKTPDGLKYVAKYGPEQGRRVLAESVARNIEIVTHKTSRVVEVLYSGPSPAHVRDVANAVVKGYIDLTTDVVMGPAQSRREQYSAQLDSLRKQIDDIQAKLTAYQQEVGITELDEKNDSASKQISELRTRLAQVQVARTETESRHAALENLLKQGNAAYEIPQISSLGSITELKNRLSMMDSQLTDMGMQYGENYPRYRSLRADRDLLKVRLDREAYTALQSIRNNQEQAMRQENLLKREIAAQEQRVLENKKHWDVISSYQRQLESTEKVYNTAIQKYDELLMSSNVSIPNSAVMRWAEMPTRAIKPSVPKNVIFSLFGGLFLGTCIAFLLELTNRRVRCVEDMAKDFDVPVLGQVGMPESRKVLVEKETKQKDAIWEEEHA